MSHLLSQAGGAESGAVRYRTFLVPWLLLSSCRSQTSAGITVAYQLHAVVALCSLPLADRVMHTGQLLFCFQLSPSQTFLLHCSVEWLLDVKIFNFLTVVAFGCWLVAVQHEFVWYAFRFVYLWTIFDKWIRKDAWTNVYLVCSTTMLSNINK